MNIVENQSIPQDSILVLSSPRVLLTNIGVSMKKANTVLACAEGEIPVHCTYSNLLDPAGLVPHPDNNNIHNATQVEIMKAALKKSGWREPIVISEKTQRIVAGHLRAMVAMEMGMKKVPVDIQIFDTEIDEIRHLTADNELARLAEFDPEKFLSTQKKIKKQIGRNEFQTTFFNPHEWGLEAYPKLEDDKPTKDKPGVLAILKEGDVWLMGSLKLTLDGTVTEFNEGHIQKFLKGWKKVHGAPAILEATGQTYEEVYDERTNH